jgi:hypothetical protein
VDWSDDTAFSHAVVSGEGTGVATPVRADVTDTNPNSPTYVSGPFGDVPVFTTSPLVLTTGQATTKATAQLKRNLGQVEFLNLYLVPNPALDVNDVVSVTRARLKLFAAQFVIEQLTLDLNYAVAQQLVGRKVQR